LNWQTFKWLLTITSVTYLTICSQPFFAKSQRSDKLPNKLSNDLEGRYKFHNTSTADKMDSRVCTFDPFSNTHITWDLSITRTTGVEELPHQCHAKVLPIICQLSHCDLSKSVIFVFLMKVINVLIDHWINENIDLLCKFNWD